MSLKRKVGLFLILILAMGVFPRPQVAMGQSEIQTINISATGYDGFVTEAGIGIDSHLAHILDPNMDIRAFLCFLDVEINGWEPVTNATLVLTSASTLAFDADSSVTVYGIDSRNVQDDFPPDPSYIISAPLTTASVNVNTSQFYGGTQLTIDVQEIVEELKSDPYWDGDGNVGATGDGMAFVILGAPDNTRYFYDYLGDPARSADLVIGFNHAPTPPATGGGDFNETYRDMNVWVIDHNGPNRTGEGFDLRWDRLNMTELTEIDSGNALNLMSDSWLNINNLQAQQINALYNDSGGGINTAFFRFGFNVTTVTNNLGAGVDRVMAVVSLSEATPVGGNGLFDDNTGDWVGLLIYLHADDAQWRFRLAEKDGANRDFGTAGAYKTEGDGAIYYGEFAYVDDGVQNYILYRIFSNPDFTGFVDYDVHALTQASVAMRYPQVSSSLDFGQSRLTGEFYTFPDFILPDNQTWVVAYPNGTIHETGLDEYEDALASIDELQGGPDPQEANPPGQDWAETGPFTRFRTRMYIFIVGFFCFWGPVWFFAWKRPDGYYLLVGGLIMLVGLGLMAQVAFV